MAAASPAWRTNQSEALWDAGDSPTQQDQQEQQQHHHQSFFDEVKLKPSRNASNSSYNDSNGDSVSELLGHDWELGSDEDDDDDDSVQEQHALVAKVSKLISQMFDTDDQFQSDDDSTGDNNNRKAQDEGNEGEKPQDAVAIDSERRSNRSSARERFLQTKLAQVLIELSAEQENLHFAASAGKELLKQLSEAQDETCDLCNQLHACQQQLGVAESEKTRLQEQQSAMERELMQYRESWTESQVKSSSNTSSSSGGGSRGRGENPPWLKSAAIKETDRESCQLCPQRNKDLKAVLNENNELKRRCLELENQHGKQRMGFEELQQRHERLQATVKKIEVRYDQSQRDVEYANAQIKQLKLDQQETIAARDNLRMTARRLQSENDNLIQKLENRDTLIYFLQSEKRVTGTNAQVLENRVSNLQLENQALVLALAESQQQLDTEKQRQKIPQLHGFDHEDQHSEGAISLQQHASDLEHLLDEAQRDLAALKVENKTLRHQQQQQQCANGSQIAHVTATFRRTKSLTTTCADILAADEAKPLLRDAQEVVITQYKRQLQLLQLDAEGFDVEDHESTLHRSLLSSFRAATVSSIQTTATAPDIPTAPTSAPGASPTFLQSVTTRRRHTVADNHIEEKEKIGEQERIRRSTLSAILPSGSSGSSASAGEAQATGDKRPAAKSPLYLGLSVIACATAAAGLLSRR